MALRKRLPHRRNGIRLVYGSGTIRVHLATGEYEDGTLGEIFLDSSKEGTFSRAMMNAFAMSVSIGLQHGVPLKTYHHTFREFRMEPDFLRDIFNDLVQHYEEKK